MNGTVDPPSIRPTAASTCCSRILSSLAICPWIDRATRTPLPISEHHRLSGQAYGRADVDSSTPDRRDRDAAADKSGQRVSVEYIQAGLMSQMRHAILP